MLAWLGCSMSLCCITCKVFNRRNACNFSICDITDMKLWQWCWWKKTFLLAVDVDRCFGQFCLLVIPPIRRWQIRYFSIHYSLSFRGSTHIVHQQCVASWTWWRCRFCCWCHAYVGLTCILLGTEPPLIGRAPIFTAASAIFLRCAEENHILYSALHCSESSTEQISGIILTPSFITVSMKGALYLYHSILKTYGRWHVPISWWHGDFSLPVIDVLSRSVFATMSYGPKPDHQYYICLLK